MGVGVVRALVVVAYGLLELASLWGQEEEEVIISLPRRKEEEERSGGEKREHHHHPSPTTSPYSAPKRERERVHSRHAGESMPLLPTMTVRERL